VVVKGVCCAEQTERLSVHFRQGFFDIYDHMHITAVSLVDIGRTASYTVGVGVRRWGIAL
jgi:hypothetical protein